MNKFLLAAVLFFYCLHGNAAWRLGHDKDAMDDSKFDLIGTDSIRPVWANKKARLVIQINCSKDSPDVRLIDPWLIDREGARTVRLDKDPATEINAPASRDLKEIYLGNGDGDLDAATLIQKFQEHKKLLVRYGELGGQYVDAEFSLVGFKAKFAKACKPPKEPAEEEELSPKSPAAPAKN